MSALESLNAGRLRAALAPDAVIGHEIVLREETTSTNDDVWALAQRGASEGIVVLAEKQTAARGQHGKSWESAPKLGLWFSFLLQPRIPVGDSARLSDWAAGVIADSIKESVALPARIQPPNDVYLGDRKVAGVLVEMRAQVASPHLAIVGIGVNVNQQPKDFSEEICGRATSLALAKGQRINRENFAEALLRNLDARYRELRAQD